MRINYEISEKTIAFISNKVQQNQRECMTMKPWKEMYIFSNCSQPSDTDDDRQKMIMGKAHTPIKKMKMTE